jgi:hypothetical protein
MVSDPIDDIIYIAIGLENKFYRMEFKISTEQLDLSYSIDASDYKFYKSEKIYIYQNLDCHHQISFPQFLINRHEPTRHAVEDSISDAYMTFATPSKILSYDPVIVKSDEDVFTMDKLGQLKKISIPDLEYI